MGRQFLPTSDSELLTWSLNFSTLITATPTAYGLVAAQATAYAALQTAYSTAFTTAIDPKTRTTGAVAAKNAARTPLKASSRSLGKMVDANLTVTDQQRRDLGLTVKVQPSPVPAPTDAPGLDVVSVSAWTAKIKLHDTATGKKRGKPAGVSGASVFSYVGATPPTDIGAWKFEGNTGKTTVDVVFSNTLAPGAKVWLTGFWFNSRKESGPACTPVGANLPGGSVSMTA
jgi:hypothetical protein